MHRLYHQNFCKDNIPISTSDHSYFTFPHDGLIECNGSIEFSEALANSFF